MFKGLSLQDSRIKKLHTSWNISPGEEKKKKKKYILQEYAILSKLLNKMRQPKRYLNSFLDT